MRDDVEERYIFPQTLTEQKRLIGIPLDEANGAGQGENADGSPEIRGRTGAAQRPHCSDKPAVLHHSQP